MAIEVRTARAEEYTEMMSMLDNVFFLEDEEVPPRTFLTLLPKLYKQQYKPWDNNYSVFEDGKIKAAVGMYVYDIEIAGQKLRVGGIGNVAVARAERRKGYMKLAMDAAMEAMVAAGCDFGELGGQRQRYQFWGFERGGAAVRASFSEKNLRHAFGENAPGSDWRAEKILPGAAETLAQVQTLIESQPLHYIHEADAFYDHLCSWGETPYAIWNRQELAGFFSLSRDQSEVGQIIIKNSEDLEMALRTAYSVMPAHPRGNKSIHVTVPLWNKDLLRLTEELSEDGVTLDETGSYAVLRWEQTLRALMLLQAQCKPLADGEMTVNIKGYCGEEALRIAVKDGAPAVESFSGKTEHNFTHLQASRYFLAPHSVLRHGDSLAHEWFPLPLCLMGIDTV